MENLIQDRRIVIAGTGSGVGKTTVTIGLMAAFRQKNKMVQGFKCGPDYIDPSYHTSVTGRASRNLDSWMLAHEDVRSIYKHASDGADISVIEGVMGFYDGKNPRSNEGSTADISLVLDCPVLLVVNCQSMARSAAAIVKGFQSLEPEVKIVGVIANQVGSSGHYRLVQEAVEQECGIPVVGYLKREDTIHIPERHLGLIPSLERGELEPYFAQIGELVSQTFDLDLIWELAASKPVTANMQLYARRAPNKQVRIAVAKDAAFHFYYQENIELLEAFGAEIVWFSPLANEQLPTDVDGLYIGGGFPEEFAERLSRQLDVIQSIRQGIEQGIPTLAECGGFMYLTEAIETTDNRSFPMVGLIPGKVTMQPKLAALGYREITGVHGNFLLGPEDKAKGHEFHYSTYQPAAAIIYAYDTVGMRGSKQEGYLQGNLVAGYTHFHFASNPQLAQRWVKACLSYRQTRQTTGGQLDA